MSGSGAETAQIVASAWRDQALWSQLAGELKADLERWRTRAAAGGVLGAVLATAASASASAGPDWHWPRVVAALAGALALAVVPYVAKTKVAPEQVRAWVRARAASEALKEAIYRYLTGAAPFDAGAPAGALIDRCLAVKQRVADLGVLAASVSAPEGKTRPTAPMNADAYLQTRVDAQIDGYYVPKAAAHAAAAKRLQQLEFGFGLLAVVLGAAAGAAVATELEGLALLAPWVAVATAAAAAVTAHRAAMRHDHGAMIYFATAERLRALRDRWRVAADRLDPAVAATFVDDCERAISTENESWLAEWSGQKSK